MVIVRLAVIPPFLIKLKNRHLFITELETERPFSFEKQTKNQIRLRKTQEKQVNFKSSDDRISQVEILGLLLKFFFQRREMMFMCLEALCEVNA